MRSTVLDQLIPTMDVQCQTHACHQKVLWEKMVWHVQQFVLLTVHQWIWSAQEAKTGMIVKGLGSAIQEKDLWEKMAMNVLPFVL